MCLNAFFPTEPEILDLMDGRVLIYPMCKSCDENCPNFEEIVLSKLKDLLKQASKIDFF